MSRRINLLVIHCSATPNGRWLSTLDIDHWHRQRGFARNASARAGFNPDLTSIGYHWVLYPNGARATGRHADEIGAHAQRFNAHSLGLCLVGTDAYTPDQWAALADQVRFLCAKHQVPVRFADVARFGVGASGICGHRDLSPDLNVDGRIDSNEWTKTCPGFSVRDWIAGGLVAPAGQVLEPRR